MILMRDSTAARSLTEMVVACCRSPSMRKRTSRPSVDGWKWMSLARRAMARSIKLSTRSVALSRGAEGFRNSVAAPRRTISSIVTVLLSRNCSLSKVCPSI